MKYEHGLSFNILINSNNEEPSNEEIYKALKKALNDLDSTNIKDAVEIFDSIIIED